MRLPLVVSMERTASISGNTSRAFISSTPTGGTMNSTGWWGRVGASGQMWVEMITSPGSGSPSICIRAILSAMATAATAPSPSETRPMRLGRAPRPPSLPTMPSVRAVPPRRCPRVPAMTILTKSVLPLPLRTSSTVMLAAG